MQYVASIKDYFKSPKWLNNTLLGGLCVLIPIVGPMVIMGWLVTGFWARADESFETFPPFTFSRFGTYLERGVWSFLVALSAAIIIAPLMMVIMIPAFILAAFSSEPNGHPNNVIAVLLPVTIMLCYFVAIMAMSLLIAPLKLRASLVQDFVKAFNFVFIKRFIALTWKEILVSTLFILVVSIAFALGGALLFCIGMYFAMVPVYFVWTHLNKQIYALYLSRGGEPVPRSPALNDDPPALPVA